MARLSCIGVEVTSCRLDVLPLLPDPVGEAPGEEDPGQLYEPHTNGHACTASQIPCMLKRLKILIMLLSL